MSIYNWSVSENGRVLASGSELLRADALQAMQDAIERIKRRRAIVVCAATTPTTSYWIAA